MLPTQVNFTKNRLYKRTELHEKFGGREQYGISNCPDHPIIFIFSKPKENQDVYEDKWENWYFYYSGEGRSGDMEFKGGNNNQQKVQKEKKEKIPLNLNQTIYVLKQYFSLH